MFPRYFIILFFSFTSLKLFGQDTIQVVLKPSSAGIQIPGDFTGLAFETNNLNNYTFVPSNDTLMRFFKTLNVQSVRIGGNSVDQDTLSLMPSATRFTETEVDSFYGFMNKANCKVIMGLNMGGDYNPSLAAFEASYVMQNFASNVWGFEVGNEPDLYDVNGLKPSYYWVNSYDTDYTQYYDSIRHYNPSAVFTGPAGAYAYATFTEPFCRNMKGMFSMLTQHYYVGGSYLAPAHQQLVTMLSQAQQNNFLNEVNSLVQCADSLPVPFRVAECNSFYGHGQLGVSNVFASSLWILDYMYSIAATGCAGVNIVAVPDWVYTPIAYSQNHYVARPDYYGILAFQLARKAKFIPASITNDTINLTIYSVIDSANNVFVTIVNKDTLQNAVVKLQAGSTNYTSADYITLSADSLTDSLNVSLGGQKVTTNGQCAPYNWQSLPVTANATQVLVTAGSAAIVRFNKTTTSIAIVREPETGYQVFPNPAVSSICVKKQQMPAAAASVAVFDVMGREKFNGYLVEKGTDVNISNLPGGIYLLKVYVDNKEYYKTTFVKE